MSNQEEEPPNIKITLIGKSGVGKTSITNQYIDHTFDENHESTVGANYVEKIVKKNGKEYQLCIWDTAGQESYKSLGKHFYKDAYVVCLVYDITDKDSFEELKETWYPNLKQYGEEFTVLAVVANKQDLYENEEQVAVDDKLGKEFAKEIDGFFATTSAKTGEGVDKLFDQLLTKYLSPEIKSKVDKKLKGKGKVTKLNGGTKKNKRCC